MQKNTGNKGKTELGDAMVTSTEIAKLIGKTSKTVQELTKDGILPAVETEHGSRVSRKYDKYQTIQAYCKFIEERAARRNGGDKEDEKLQVEIDIKKTKMKMEQLRLDELEGRLHDSEDVEGMTTDLVLCVRSNLLAMPGKLAVDLAGTGDAQEISARIQQEIHEILNDLANYEYNAEEYARRVRERHGWKDREEEEYEEG